MSMCAYFYIICHVVVNSQSFQNEARLLKVHSSAPVSEWEKNMVQYLFKFFFYALSSLKKIF